jgi:uncharacterized protein
VAQDVLPSFDCARAANDIERMVCIDSDLAMLDRRMADVYAHAMASWPADIAAAERVMQRGWIKGRDDCWKADDIRVCVQEAYLTRIVQLQIQSGQLMPPTVAEFACDGSAEKAFAARFYGDTDPPSAVLTYGEDQTIVFRSRAASGARYTASGVEFWEHQGEATVDFYGIMLRCTLSDRD